MAFGFHILHSYDFNECAVSGSMLSMLDKTGKAHTYNLKSEVAKFKLIDTDKVQTLAMGQTAAAVGVEACLAFGNWTGALISLWLGSQLPTNSKDVYVVGIEFIDKKSAILQMNNNKYEHFLKYVGVSDDKS